MGFQFLFTHLFTILVIISNLSKAKDIRVVFLAEEIGFGVKGVTHYLNHLLEGCDNVGDLNKWILFMESYLSCEGNAWPFISDEEKLVKSEKELIEHFCNAWPNRLKCGGKLAKRLDLCYGAEIENGRIGTYALKFSNTFANVICRNKNEYLESLTENSNVPADRRSLNCYAKNKDKINTCVQEQGLLLLNTDPCTNLDMMQLCFTTHLGTDSCKSKSPLTWITKVLLKLKSEFYC